MSRVHDALRRAAAANPDQPAPPEGATAPPAPPATALPRVRRPEPEPEPAPVKAGGVVPQSIAAQIVSSALASSASAPSASATAVADREIVDRGGYDSRSLLDRIETVPYSPPPDSLLIDPTRPHEAPTEEFRSLRTRLNHMQNMQPIHSVVVTSASPAEGKSFTATNLAIAQSQLAGSRTLLCDFDFRRPIVHNYFQLNRSPGLTDYLLGKAQLHEIIKRIADTNLYVVPAGEAVINPLELLNLPAVKSLVDDLPQLFNWVILDTPPLLFAADANLMSTLAHGTIIVVRIGNTTIDSVTRAVQSLCHNNVLGIVVNGARRGELYSKYSYYHSYYQPKDENVEEAAGAPQSSGS